MHLLSAERCRVCDTFLFWTIAADEFNLIHNIADDLRPVVITFADSLEDLSLEFGIIAKINWCEVAASLAYALAEQTAN